MDPHTLSPCVDSIRSTCSKPGLLLVTHYFGLSADMDAILQAVSGRGITIVEDCAHSPGITFNGQPVGTFGVGGFFSFETRKPLNGLGGGMIVSDDDVIATQLAKLPKEGNASSMMSARKTMMTAVEWLMLRRPVFSMLAPLIHRESGKAGLIAMYRKAHALGRSPVHGFSDFQAALVLAQIPGLEHQQEHRSALAKAYSALPEAFVRPVQDPRRPHGYYMYVVTHPRGRAVGTALRKNGIDCGIGPEVLADCADGALRGTKTVVETAIELPMFDQMTLEDAGRVCRIASMVDSHR